MFERIKNIIFGFSSRHPRAVITGTLLLTIFFGYQAAHIDINAEYTSLLPKDTEVNRLIREYGGEKPDSDLLVVAIKGKDLYTEEILTAFRESLGAIEALPEVLSVVSPFNFLVFEKSPGGRLGIARTADGDMDTFSAEGIEEFTSRLFSSSFAENLVVSRDHTMLTAFIMTEKRDEYAHLISEVDTLLTRMSFPGVSTHTSGPVILTERTRYYISHDVALLVGLAVIIIILFYYLSFRTGKATFLPILVVLFGTVWSIGFMHLAGYALTLISIVAPPLILIFGNEYAIYVMSEYYRIIGGESGSRVFPDRTLQIQGTVRNVAKPILLAFVTTVIGFMSLYVTEIKQTQEFAVVAGFGSLACGFLSLFFLPAVLSLAKGTKKTKEPILPYRRYREALSSLSAHHPGKVLLIIPAVIILFLVSLKFLQFNTDSINYFPRKDPAIRDMYVLTEGIGGFDEIHVTFLAPEGETGYFLKADVLEDILNLQRDIEENPDVCYSSSFPAYIEEIGSVMENRNGEELSPGLIRLVARLLKTASSSGGLGSGLQGLLNADYTRLTVTLRIYNSTTGHFIDEYRFREFLAFLENTLADHGFDEDGRVIWGEIMRNLHLADSLRGYLLISMVISLGLILVITTATFRSVLYGIYAVLPLALGLMFNFTLMALFRIPLDMTTIMVSNVTIGVGIDNAFYLVVQYRRSAEKNHSSFRSLIDETLEVILRPTVLSTLSIIFGLMVFLMAAFKPIVYFGMLVIFSLTATAICTLIVIPAILNFDYRKRTG